MKSLWIKARLFFNSIMLFLMVLTFVVGNAEGSSIINFASKDSHQHETFDNQDSQHTDESLDDHDERIVMSDEIVQKAGIGIKHAAPETIKHTLQLFGEITAIPEQQFLVSAPYSGLVESLKVKVGDLVVKGQVLATIHNTASLNSYDVVAPASGEISHKYVRLGERITEQPLFEITDLSTVRLQMSAFSADLEQLALGQTVQVRDLHDHNATLTQISYLSARMNTQHIAQAQAVLPNDMGFWRPGAHVKADVTVSNRQVKVVVAKTALQQFENQLVVFVRQDNAFIVKPVQLGQADDTYVEIISGLVAGERYASDNSFVLKADLMKASANHAH